MTTCFCVDPSTCAACRVDAYRARDLRISIGLPVKQDNGEYEYPGYLDDKLIGFYATRHTADLALHNILDMAELVQGATPMLDLDFVSVGWA
jgi:hypothetical protein